MARTIATAERTLPSNLEAERAVLGTLIVAPDRIDEVAAVVGPEHFYRDAHRVVMEHLLALHQRQVRPDFITLKEALGDRLEDVGGPSYIASLVDGVPRATNVEYYARIVREKAILRDLIYAANKILVEAYEGDDPQAVLELAEKEVYAIGAREDGTSRLHDVDALTATALRVLAVAHDTGRPVIGVPTGLTDLDTPTRGMSPGQLIVIAARPGMGKSSLWLNILRNVARTHTALGFSLEMDDVEVGVRLVASESQLNAHRAMRGQLGEVDYANIANATCSLQGARLLIDDTPRRSVDQIRSIARRVQAQRRDLAVIGVDYLQLMTPGKGRRGEEKRTLEIGDMTRELKIMAKELNVPVLVLSALNRAPEQRKDPAPQLSDLAESGAIEKDSSGVWFLYQTKDDPDENTARVKIAKNRSGPKVIVPLAYFEEQYRFANKAHEEEA